jgi:hypothetical protein
LDKEKLIDSSDHTVISLHYGNHLVTCTESSRPRHSRAAARKQELCSKNRTSAMGTKKPKAKALSDSKDDLDFGGISVHSNSSDVCYVFVLIPKIIGGRG